MGALGSREQVQAAPGSVSRTVWPYLFSIQPVDVLPGSTIVQTFTINNVASFVAGSIIKAVFTKAGGVYTYLDPDAQGAAGFAPGLKIAFQNVSTRNLYTAAPINVDNIGSPTRPFMLPSKLLLQPNNALQVTISNGSGTATYAAGFVLSGFRTGGVMDPSRLLSVNSQG